MKTVRCKFWNWCSSVSSATGTNFFWIAVIALSCALAGCSQNPGQGGSGASGAGGEKMFQPARGEFSVMTYSLGGFAVEERNGAGHPTTFKPDAEVQAECAIIANASPDVLVCQDIGDGAAFQKLRDGLKSAGLDYPHAEQLVMAGETTHITLLSRFPIAAYEPVTNEVFTIAGESHRVEHGFLCADIQVNDGYQFKLVCVHLRSKRFVVTGQTEMRRNEARLLNKIVRHFLHDKPDLNLLVVGDLSDSPKSAAVREVISGSGTPVLDDLRPADSLGAVWTHLLPAEDNYERWDYLLCSPGMLRETVAPKCRVVEDPLVLKASDHRPVVAVFHAQDL